MKIILSYWAGRYGHLDTLNSKIRPLVMILSLFLFLVPFVTTMEMVAPLEIDPILLGTSIRQFRHLELQNPSTIADFRDRQEKSEEEQQQEQQEQEDPIIIEEDVYVHLCRLCTCACKYRSQTFFCASLMPI